MMTARLPEQPERSIRTSKGSSTVSSSSRCCCCSSRQYVTSACITRSGSTDERQKLESAITIILSPLRPGLSLSLARLQRRLSRRNSGHGPGCPARVVRGWALALKVVFARARAHRIRRFDGYEAPPLLLQPAPGFVFFIEVTHNISGNSKDHRPQQVSMFPVYHLFPTFSK